MTAPPQSAPTALNPNAPWYTSHQFRMEDGKAKLHSIKIHEEPEDLAQLAASNRHIITVAVDKKARRGRRNGKNIADIIISLPKILMHIRAISHLLNEAAKNSTEDLQHVKELEKFLIKAEGYLS